MFGQKFYNGTVRKMVAVFGTLFNDIKIDRFDNAGNLQQTLPVPMSYGPRQRFLAKIEEDPNLQREPAITLPRMSFEIASIVYDPERKVNTLNYITDTNNNDNYNAVFSPTPYNITFELSIMVKYAEDGTKILEQILPFFTPDWTPSVQMLDNMDKYFDIPIILEDTSVEDTYEADFITRRAVIWTLTFTMKTYFFGPTTEKKVIKFANTQIFADTTANNASVHIDVRPGLTANGEPTTDANNSVHYSNINVDDDWDYIVVIEGT